MAVKQSYINELSAILLQELLRVLIIKTVYIGSLRICFYTNTITWQKYKINLESIQWHEINTVKNLIQELKQLSYNMQLGFVCIQ